MDETIGSVVSEVETDRLYEQLRDRLFRLNWLQHRRFAQELSGFQLTVPQFHTLSALVSLDGVATVGQLTKHTHQVSATMTGIVDRLHRDKLVVRRNDEMDRRTVRIAITPAGRVIVENVWDRTLQSMDNVVSDMNSADKATALHFVDSLVSAMED
ncbi:MAG: MarR family transcriptional regulator [Chloroflexi bacterium]|nr:MarR family transcriptional regulator [Chloroflexota bacterium]